MKIGTHNGVFHADDVFACAIIAKAHFYKTSEHCEFVRTRDPEILATCDLRVDVGGKYVPLTGDYDHHQDLKLAAASTLVFLAFVDDLVVSGQPITPYVIGEVKRVLFDPISGLDCNLTGYIKDHPDNGYLHISNIISAMNRVEMGEAIQQMVFQWAVEFAERILGDCIYQASQKEATLKIIKRGVKITPSVTLFDSGFAFNQFRDNPDVSGILVMPYTDGNWQVVSMDTSKFFLSTEGKTADGLVFAHKAGFFASFLTKEQAVAFALLINSRIL